MVAIPFPTSTSPGRNPAESGGRLINAYAEALSGGASAAAVIRRAPGLRVFCNAGYDNFRGGIYVAPYLYAAFENAMVKIDATGAVELIAPFNGDGPVFFARNNKVPVADIIAVSEDGTFVVTASSVDELVDPDLPPPNSVCAVDGYFFWSIANGQVFASGLNATTVNALDVTKAEANPDGLSRVVGFQSQLYMCGSSTIEIWSNTGNAVGFPFSRATVIPRGIIGRLAVTGVDDGFSKQPMFVGDDCQVYALSGYQITKLSQPDLDYLIQMDPNKGDISCWVYTVSGHPCLVVSGTGWTWVYDLQTQKWHERRSYESAVWRASGSVYVFGTWLVGDRSSTNVLELTESTRDEAGQPLVWEVESGQGSGFPNRLRIPRADFDFVQAVGITTGVDPIEVNPKVRIEWSDDGGSFWSQPVERPLGKQGETRTRVTVTPCGSTGPKGRRWRLKVSDPVYAGLLSGDMAVQARAN